jgi:hypothetical protein
MVLVSMSDPKHPTNREWVMFDPEEFPPPRGPELLVVTEGGVLIKHPWFDGAIAWAYKPVLPKSVKERNVRKYEA